MEFVSELPVEVQIAAVSGRVCVLLSLSMTSSCWPFDLEALMAPHRAVKGVEASCPVVFDSLLVWTMWAQWRKFHCSDSHSINHLFNFYWFLCVCLNVFLFRKSIDDTETYYLLTQHYLFIIAVTVSQRFPSWLAFTTSTWLYILKSAVIIFCSWFYH